jgi:hypothetical protein
MQLRAATLVVLPLLVCSIVCYSAPTTSPAPQLIVEAISGNPPLNSLGAEQQTAPGSLTSFSELLPTASDESMPITTDRTDTEQGSVLLPLLGMLILLFGMMALPIDPGGMSLPAHLRCRKR